MNVATAAAALTQHTLILTYLLNVRRGLRTNAETQG